MKVVSGTVLSSKPVSLSKAARTLSKFSSSDHCAAPAFGAYLKRASGAFDELVQLHKKHEGAGFEPKVSKKNLSSGITNNETINSVRKPSNDGLIPEEKQGTSDGKKHKGRGSEGEDKELESSVKIDGQRKREKKKKDEGEGSSGTRMEGQISEGIVDGNAAQLSGDGKKLKQKKRQSDESLASVDKDQTDCDFDAMGAIQVKNEIERQNEVKETNKKKKKRDKGEKENTDGAVRIKEEEQSCPPGQNYGDGEASDIAQNDGHEQKKHKKKKKKVKEEKADGIRAADNQVKIEGGEGKKHKKKQSHDGEQGGNEGKVEIKETDEKESQKRKHKGDADEDRTVNTQVKIEGGEKKQHKKKQSHEGEENGGKVEIEEAGEKESRKRKHKGDDDRGLDYSEEQQRSKKKKKKIK